MRSLKRVLSTLLLSAIFFTSVPALAVTDAQAAAPEGRTVYFMNDFDDFMIDNSTGNYQLPSEGGNWNLPAPYQYYHNDIPGSDCSIYKYMGNGTPHLMLHNSSNVRVYRWLDDVGAIWDDTVTSYVYEWEMRIDDNSEGWRVDPFINVPAAGNGQIEGTTSAYAKIGLNMKKIAVEVNKSNKTYDLYVDQKRVKSNVPFSAAASNYHLTFQNEFNQNATKSSYLIIDNLTAYSGTYDEGEKFPVEPTEGTWFYNDFENATISDLPQSGFMKMRSPYQNYYIERSTLDAGSITTVSEAQRGKVLKMTRGLAGIGNRVLFYRFADDNVGPGTINTSNIFTYEMDVKVDDNNTTWDLGFFNDTNDKHALATINTQNGDHWDKAYLSGMGVGQWQKVAIEVNRSANTYRVYLNEQPVISKSKSLGTIKAFMIKGDFSGTGSIYVDNMTAYPGEYQDKYLINESYTWGSGYIADTGFWSEPLNLYYTDIPGTSVSKDPIWGPYHDWTISLSNATQGRFLRFLDDNSARTDDSTQYYVYEWNFNVEEFSETWRVEPFFVIRADQGGLIEGSENSYGRVTADSQWDVLTITAEVNKQTSTFNLYYNGVRVRKNVPFTDNNRLTYQHDNLEHAKTGKFRLYNFKAYKGRYIDGEVRPEPADSVWFRDDYSYRLSQDKLNTIPQTGFWGIGSPYQNYYSERSSYTSVNAVDGALQLSLSSKSNNTLYRFVDDNLCPGGINTGGTFTYKMRIRTSGNSWDIGFLNDSSIGSKKELVTLNKAYGDYYAKENLSVTSNQWNELAIEVNQETNGYKVYLNGVLKIEKSLDIGTIKAFMIKNDFGSGTCDLGYLTAYPGAFRG